MTRIIVIFYNLNSIINNIAMSCHNEHTTRHDLYICIIDNIYF